MPCFPHRTGRSIKESQMNRTQRNALFAFGLFIPALAFGQTSWPGFMPTLQPGQSRSTVPAPPCPADMSIEPPSSELPAEKVKWSGQWAGWACPGRSCDTKLDVEKVTAQGASVVYSIGSTQGQREVGRVDAQFVGDELHFVSPSGNKIAYRIRSDGNLEYFSTDKTELWIVGILSKRRQ